MTDVVAVRRDDDLEIVRTLVLEYLAWVVAQTEKEYGEKIDLDSAFDHAWGKIGLFHAPTGLILLARQGGAAAGVAFLKKLPPGICEVKRVYVRPDFRGNNIGNQLMARLIHEARELGYARMFLDTAKFMRAAHVVYRALGFKETEIYTDSEYGDNFAKHLIFMEFVL